MLCLKYDKRWLSRNCFSVLSPLFMKVFYLTAGISNSLGYGLTSMVMTCSLSDQRNIIMKNNFLELLQKNSPPLFGKIPARDRITRESATDGVSPHGKKNVDRCNSPGRNTRWYR